MDHRCLYGHRVPAAFTFAIQSRSCPTCGSNTVSINGYQVARRLATDAGLDAMAAFNAVRVIEKDWTFVSVNTAPEAAVAPSPAALSAPEEDSAARSTKEDDVEIVDEDADRATAPPPPPPPVPTLKPVVRGGARASGRPEGERPSARSAFDPGDEDFFKGV